MQGREANCFVMPMGFIASYLFFKSMYDQNGEISMFTDNGTFLQEISWLLILSMVYFVIDFILMIIRFNPKNNIYFLHHALSIMAIYLVSTNYYYLVKYLLGYLMYELSTPFLNARKHFKRRNITNTFTKIIDVFFLTFFFAIRIIFGTILSYRLIPFLYAMGQPHSYLIALPICLQILNYYWLCQIIAMYLEKKKLGKKYSNLYVEVKVD